MNTNFIMENSLDVDLRRTSQFLMPVRLDKNSIDTDTYNAYPVKSLGSKKIFNGFGSLANYIVEQKTVVIDGYVGVFWDKIESELQSYFNEQQVDVNWVRTADFLKPVAEITELTAPFLGESESVWGTKTSLTLADLFSEGLKSSVSENGSKINILIGCGAALSNWKGSVIYIDLPKNELQFRMSAGSITNLGLDTPKEGFKMYKHFFFIDWVMLNQHKKDLLDRIDVIVDGQWPYTINWAYKKDIEKGIDIISKSIMRPRPWFSPGVWGGQWMKEHIPQLNPEAVNYAWSFELIAPESGIVFESDGFLLEVSFDTMMFMRNKNVLGKFAERFGDEFPIRFDFLDTIEGGNLSIQCHPSVKYIQDNFGEKLTQDETYYILDCNDKAKVYLGFQEDINPEVFKQKLKESQENNEELEIEEFVQVFNAKKHDFFLIPNQTIHSSGAGNLVLEISATPYIFTFKMYDWLSLDLEGKPRPINIEHAFNNLDFSRKGDKVQEELISKPYVLEDAADYQIIHLPTHKDHFYDVHRVEFDNEVKLTTDDSCQLLMLVEGESVFVETLDGEVFKFAYAETFMVPAAAGSYKLINKGQKRIKVIKTFLK